MADSLLASLFGMLDSRSVGGIAGALAEPEQSVLQCLKSSIASVLGGMALKSEDPDSLRHMLDMAPADAGDTTLAQFADAASDANSPVISRGRRLLSSLFGSAEPVVTNAVSAASGLRPGATSTISAMAAPMVVGFLGQRVRAEGMNMRGLGNLLQSETGAIRNALPASVADLFWPSKVRNGTPVIAQSVVKERSSFRWLALLALVVLVGGAMFWLLNHARRSVVPGAGPVTTSATPRAETDSIGTLNRDLLSNARLRFETGSAKLSPQSGRPLDDITATLMANPDVHVKIAGYTDNVGNPEKNVQLSRERADAVMSALVSRGVSADRIVVEGRGEESPIDNNSTAAGRARNRRVSLDLWLPRS